ncbi:uncharacterized protein E0L32_003020 [Thyridium curvatum]|uniref:Uncharacterized protein n=1 Tax=Thyridium curvatum TaxID=1093900 RepID=A0A507BBU8_9PEZI|nr:uncharacterized protein E0L32_003020 [Thyridium curvatum]TPX17377.1 hypothetical protein E0L32_003020 [Thyridium curvatum]
MNANNNNNTSKFLSSSVDAFPLSPDPDGWVAGSRRLSRTETPQTASPVGGRENEPSAARALLQLRYGSQESDGVVRETEMRTELRDSQTLASTPLTRPRYTESDPSRPVNATRHLEASPFTPSTLRLAWPGLTPLARTSAGNQQVHQRPTPMPSQVALPLPLPLHHHPEAGPGSPFQPAPGSVLPLPIPTQTGVSRPRPYAPYPPVPFRAPHLGLAPPPALPRAPTTASQRPRDPILGGSVHNEWTKKHAPTAICDFCNRKRHKTLQQCTRCATQCCFECMLHRRFDSQHHLSEGTTDWEVTRRPRRRARVRAKARLQRAHSDADAGGAPPPTAQ